MLKDKDNEENAVKRFKEWIGDLPVVAHNAKFGHFIYRNGLSKI